MKKIILIAALFGLIGCTENTRTAQYGGQQTINLPRGKKLVNVTWKSISNAPAGLWMLTRERRNDEIPEMHEFYEKSAWGLMEGKVTIVEH